MSDTKPEGQSEITLLLTAYDQGYTAKFGDRPRIVPGKDAKLAQDLLKLKSLETLTGYFPRFFASREKLIVEAGYTFAIFAFRINALATAKASQPAAEPASDAHRERIAAIRASEVAQQTAAPIQAVQAPTYLTDAERQDLMSKMRATMAKLEEKEMK